MPTATRKTRAPRSGPAPAGTPFGPGLFQFLGELALQNERAWFEQHKDRYETEVRAPALELIRRLAPHVFKVSKHLVVSDKKVGGSLMRIHRDVRFGADKTPYKTNVGIHFRHEAGKDVHAPGIYLHLEVDSVFLGAGMWHPDKEALAALRRSIVDAPAAWKKVRDHAMFQQGWSLRGDSLSRPPRGFDPDHPRIEDLKRKDFIAVLDLPASLPTAPELVDVVAARMQEVRPLMAWQAKALDLAF